MRQHLLKVNASDLEEQEQCLWWPPVVAGSGPHVARPLWQLGLGLVLELVLGLVLGPPVAQAQAHFEVVSPPPMVKALAPAMM